MRNICWRIPTAVLSLALSAGLNGSPLVSAGARPPSEQIAVRLTTDRKVYRLGQPVLVTCTLENVSDRPLYVYRHVQLVSGANAGLRVTIRDERNRSPIGGLSSDAFFLGYRPSTPVEQIVREQWVLLQPGEVRSYLGLLPSRPEKPGRYRLTGTYFDHTPRYLTESQREALKNLDHPILVGEFPATSVWIEIRR